MKLRRLSRTSAPTFGTHDALGERKLRITILGLNYAPEPTGNAPYTTSLAEGLTKRGHLVSVVTGYPHYPEWRVKEGYSGWTKTEEINGVTIRRLKHYVPNRPSAAGRLHMELSFGLRLLCSSWGNPDVVLVVSPALISSGLAILRARLRSKRPAVGIWVQDLYSRGVIETGSSSSLLARVASGLESGILRSTDGVAAIHDRFKAHMVRGLRIPAAKVQVIRNWTHLADASPLSSTHEMRQKLGWKPTEVVVLHAGNMGVKQGLENVVDAARIASERASAVRFVLMGDGNQRRKLEVLSKDIPNITFLDPLPHSEFQSALASADILLVNERRGVKDMAVPSKLTSYFSSGTPVLVATEDDSVTAFEIETSGGGLRIDPDDPAALVNAAESLVQDPGLVQRLVTNALRFRYETLSEATAVADYDEFITRLASSRGR